MWKLAEATILSLVLYIIEYFKEPDREIERIHSSSLCLSLSLPCLVFFKSFCDSYEKILYIIHTYIFFFHFSFTYYMIESCVTYTMDQLCVDRWKIIFREATRRKNARYILLCTRRIAPYIFVYLHEKETKPHSHTHTHSTRARAYMYKYLFSLSLSLFFSIIGRWLAHLLCLQFVLRMYCYASWIFKRLYALDSVYNMYNSA